MATETAANTFSREFRKVIAPAGADLTRVDDTPAFAAHTEASDHRGGRYVYLKATNTVTRLHWVSLRRDNAQAHATKAIVDTYRPIGVACAGIAANKYGWFQTTGQAYGAFAASMAAGGATYTTSTAGILDDTSTSQTFVQRIWCQQANSDSSNAALLQCWIDHPSR